MNDEIKEILEDWKIGIETGKDMHGIKVDGMGYTWKELKILLDYITNLQEQLHQASLDIQELTERDIECPSWCDKLTNLQQENNNLKTSLDESQEVVIDLQRENERLKSQIEYANKINNEAINRKNKYKSRIEKAVEYVKECYTQPTNIENFMHEGEMNYLLNILNGRSDE